MDSVTITGLSTNDEENWESARQFCKTTISEALKEDQTYQDWSTESAFLKGKLYPNCPVPCFVSTKFIPGALVSSCVDLQWNLTLDEQKETRSSLLSVDIIENVDSDTRISVQVVEMTWPVWDRQVVVYEKKDCSQNEGWVISVSTTHLRAPLQESKYVRARILASAWGFIREKEGVRVWRILHMNPNGDGKGAIPESLINKMSGNNVAQSCNWFVSRLFR